MRHQVRTKKFESGKDANRMLLRKLSRNFFLKGRLITSISRAKALKPNVEHMVNLAKRNTEGGKNVLLKKTGDRHLVSLLMKQVAPVFQEKAGGFVRVVRIGARSSDGSEIARLEWTLPVVLEKKEKVELKKPAIEVTPEQKKPASKVKKKV